MNIKELQRKLIRVIDKTVNNTLKEMGEESVDLITLRTIDGGKVVQNEGRRKKLPKLKRSTINRRTSLSRRGQLSGDTSPSKANNTKSGHTLNSIDSNISLSANSIKIGTEDNTANERIKQLHKSGREFLNMSKVEVNKITKTLSKALKRALKQVR